MKRIISLLILISLLALGTVSADPGSPWSKYVTADKNLSFHYPSGWKVSNVDQWWRLRIPRLKKSWS